MKPIDYSKEVEARAPRDENGEILTGEMSYMDQLALAGHGMITDTSGEVVARSIPVMHQLVELKRRPQEIE